MKILIATGIFEPEIGGPATYASQLGKLLTIEGHKVEVITYSNKKEFPQDRSFPFRLTRIVRSNKLFNYVHYFFAVYRRAKSFDLIYSLDWFSAGVPVMCAAKISKKKYIVRVGGGYIWEKYLSEGKTPLPLSDFYEKGLHRKYPVMFWFIKKVLQNAFQVIFNSEQQKNLYEKFYCLPNEKTTVIENPIEPKKLDVSALNPEREKEIVFAGRFIVMKNVETALRGFALWGDKSFRFTLFGEGPQKHILQELVRDLKISDRVTFLPVLKKDELYRRIINCYYVILPSWTDISPNQIYECLSLGIPFLLTKENFLSINNFDFLKIDPRSPEDVSRAMKWLSNSQNYEKHLSDIRAIEFTYSWADALRDHLKIFNAAL